VLLLRSSTGSELVVDPQSGGGLKAWRCRGRDVLRPAPAAITDPLQLASFPLVPFSNRIGYGRFRHAGRAVQLPRNWTRDPHTIHGFGWTAPWAIAACTASTANLELAYRADGWPWSFRAVQHISVDADVLDLKLTLTNLDFEAMPAGLGQHPCFPRPPGTRLTAATQSIWLTSADGLPERRAAVPEEWRFDTGGALDGLDLDHVFDGWNREPVLRWPDGAGVRIAASDAARFLVVYAPAAHELVCLEPVTHVTDAVNRPEPPEITGYRLLPPGETLELALRLEFHER
jgi:aldose 1-epimerase